MPPARSLKTAPPKEEFGSGQDLSLGELENLLGFHLRRAQGAMHRDFVETLAEFDVTQKQVATLVLVSANPGVSQIQIAGQVDMDRATMMAIVDRLEQRGLLLRRRSKTDRRRQELHLTPKGEKMLKAARTKIAEHERRFKGRLSEPELQALIAVLRRLYE